MQLYDLLLMLIENLEEEAQTISKSAKWTQYFYLGAMIVCLVQSGIVAVSAAKAVAVPFLKLHQTSNRLREESENIAEHAEVTGRFVPYETLKLIGVSDIAELELGQSVLKRLTIMFGDIVSFTLLSSKLTPDDVFRYINFWLQGLIPIIQVIRVVSHFICLVQPPPPPPVRESRISRTAPNSGPYSGFSEP